MLFLSVRAWILNFTVGVKSVLMLELCMLSSGNHFNKALTQSYTINMDLIWMDGDRIKTKLS